MKLQSKGFTFVELIVVVVILGILGAIGLISYSAYLGGSRDSNRITQLSDIKSGLSIYGATKKLPNPEDSVNVLANANIVGTQGYVGASVLKQIGYQDGGIDPLDKTYFTYYLAKNGKNFQLLAFLEEQDVVTYSPVAQTYANEIDYSERFPTVTGNRLGILVQDETNTPIQELGAGDVDIVITGSSFDAYYSDSEIISGTGGILKQTIPNQSCKRLLDLGNHNGSGIYKINPTGANEFQAYCDMETDGGGWTFFGHYDSTSNGSTLAGGFFQTALGTYLPTREDNNTAYSINASQLGHTEMMATLGTASINQAQSDKRIVFFSYTQNHPAFYTGPSPCIGLDQAFSYKITPSEDYKIATYQFCTTTAWYPRDNNNSGFLALFQNGTSGNYWGFGMGGNNSWGNDGWWYVR